MIISSGASGHAEVNAVLPGPTDTPMMSNPIRAAKKDATPMGLAWAAAPTRPADRPTEPSPADD